MFGLFSEKKLKLNETDNLFYKETYQSTLSNTVFNQLPIPIQTFVVQQRIQLLNNDKTGHNGEYDFVFNNLRKTADNLDVKIALVNLEHDTRFSASQRQALTNVVTRTFPRAFPVTVTELFEHLKESFSHYINAGLSFFYSPTITQQPSEPENLHVAKPHQG